MRKKSQSHNIDIYLNTVIDVKKTSNYINQLLVIIKHYTYGCHKKQM